MHTTLATCLLSVACATALIACGGGGSSPPPQSGEPPALTLLAGDVGGPGSLEGTGSQARLNGLVSIASDAQGNLYTAGGVTYITRTTQAGEVSAYARPLPAFATNNPASFQPGVMPPYHIATDPAGNVFTCDFIGIRMVGTNGSSRAIKSCGGGPGGMTADASGNIYFVRGSSSAVYKIDPQGNESLFAGHESERGWADGPAGTARFAGARDLVADAAGNLYVTDSGAEFGIGEVHRIRKITPGGQVSTFAGEAGVPAATVDGVGAAARFNGPQRITIDGAGNLYVMETGGFRKVTPASAVTTLQLSGEPIPGATSAGVGPPVTADFTADPAGNLYLVGNWHWITKIDVQGRVSILAGLPRQPLTAGSVIAPTRPVAGADGSVYFLQAGGAGAGAVRMATPQGELRTVADFSGQPPSFLGRLTGLARDPADNVYLAEDSIDSFFGGPVRVGGGSIRKLAPDGTLSVLAGVPGDYGRIDGTGASARLDRPADLALDGQGNLYTGDGPSVRRISSSGAVTTVVTLEATATIANVGISPGGAIWFSTADGRVMRLGDSGVVLQAQVPSAGDIAFDAADKAYVVSGTTVVAVGSGGSLTTVAGLAQQDGLRTGTLPARLCNRSQIALLQSNVLAVTSCDAVLRLAVP